MSGMSNSTTVTHAAVAAQRLHPPAQGEAGHHALGAAGEWQLRRNRYDGQDGRAGAVRHQLSAELVADDGPTDHFE